MYDYIVVGGGILGASVILNLIENGETNIAYVSDFSFKIFKTSHKDTSRLLKSHGEDNRWKKWVFLTKQYYENSLKAHVGNQYYKPCKVYNGSSLNEKIRISLRNSADFIEHGAIINPLSYIQNVKDICTSNGIDIIDYEVVGLSKNSVETSKGFLLSNKIIDCRGAYLSLEEQDANVVAKRFFIFDKYLGEEDFCFSIDVDDHYISNIYGIYENEHSKFKVGVTESGPKKLLSMKQIESWFHKDYNECNDEIFIVDKIREVLMLDEEYSIKPCMFSITDNGFPIIKNDNGICKIYGCNGKFAKSSFGFVKENIKAIL